MDYTICHQEENRETEKFLNKKKIVTLSEKKKKFRKLKFFITLSWVSALKICSCG